MEALRKSEAGASSAGPTRGLTPPLNRSYSDCRANAFPGMASRGRLSLKTSRRPTPMWFAPGSLHDGRSRRTDNLPTSAEGIDPFAIRHTRRRVGDEVVERMSVIRDLRGAVIARGGSKKALRDATNGSWSARRGHGWPVLRALSIARRSRSGVGKEEIQRLAIGADKDLPETADAVHCYGGACRRRGGGGYLCRCGTGRRGRHLRGTGGRGGCASRQRAGCCGAACSNTQQTDDSTQDYKCSSHWISSPRRPPHIDSSHMDTWLRYTRSRLVVGVRSGDTLLPGRRSAARQQFTKTAAAPGRDQGQQPSARPGAASCGESHG